jgi:hypothetical protein
VPRCGIGILAARESVLEPPAFLVPAPAEFEGSFLRSSDTRRERAENVKKRDVFTKYEGQARAVLDALLATADLLKEGRPDAGGRRGGPETSWPDAPHFGSSAPGVPGLFHRPSVNSPA